MASSTTLIPSSTASLTSAVASASSSAAASKGMSSGASAGLAIGLIIFAFAGIGVFFLYRRKQKKQAAYGNLDEKNGAAAAARGPGGATATVPAVAVTEFNEKLAPTPSITSEHAPQVSLRHVSQFMPNVGGAGAAAGAAGAAAAAQRSQGAQPSQLGRSPSRKEPPPALVIDQSHAVPVAPDSGPLPAPKRPSSPTPSGFTDSSVTAGPFNTPIGPGPHDPATAPVHRVQMDFTPSMGDELELRGGQLVRILHEYDDGWALCMRMDRSQQGVCPRTCLSQAPLKPRNGPPQGPQAGPPGAPRGPPGAPRGPPHPGFANAPRPQSPNGFPTPSGHHNGAPGAAPEGRQSPLPQSPVVRSQSPVIRTGSPASQPQSPRTASGYYKPQYKPASLPTDPASVPLPPTPTITISPWDDEPPASPQPQSPQSPVLPAVLKPAVAPVRPSPLSNQTNSEEVEEKKGEELNFELPAQPVEPEQKPEQQLEPQPEPQPEPEPEPQPESQPEPETERQPESQPEQQPEPQPEVKPEPQPEPQPEIKPEPQQEPQPEQRPLSTSGPVFHAM
jgi:cbb3-type cytochrome oxidase subunit 3